MSPIARVELARVAATELHRLETAAELADRRGERLAWVGGGVRDLLLELGGLDLDLVLEGDLSVFTTQLADRLGARCAGPTRFLTTTLAWPDGTRLDVVRARRERYRAPAALPEVEPASLAEDLARRDFTINAMAVTLAPVAGWGNLTDPQGGRVDLETGLLRGHHPRTFVDDPTRLLRGARFARRFGFRFEAETRAWARAAAEDRVMDQLSGARLAHELRLLFDDRREIEEALVALAELDLAAALSAALADDEILARAVALGRGLRREAGRLALPREAGRWRLALLAVAATVGAPAAAALASRLALPGAESDLVRAGPGRALRARARLAPAARPHQVVEALTPLVAEELALVAAGDSGAAAWVERWLGDLRHVRLRLAASDLLAAGIAPGPRIGQALRAVRRARLDGAISAGEELDFALRRARTGEPP